MLRQMSAPSQRPRTGVKAYQPKDLKDRGFGSNISLKKERRICCRSVRRTPQMELLNAVFFVFCFTTRSTSLNAFADSDRQDAS